MQSKQITTITFFKYAGASNKLWALSQMQRSIDALIKTEGLEFFKLMGSGAGEGFSLRPDFSAYCLLGVWKNESAANLFFTHSEVYQKFVLHSMEQWTVFTHVTRVRGLWSGLQPFKDYPELTTKGIKIALTRASINWNRLIDFWKHVPASSQAIATAEGVLFSKGVGELPFVQQATISVWESENAMRKFAYQDKAHREIVAKTVKRKWYSEELFASFVAFRETGTWEGKTLFSIIESEPLP